MSRPDACNVKALYFDVFGTVTDWYSTIVREGAEITRITGVSVNWGEFAFKWRIDGYIAALIKIASGEMDIVATEEIHRQKLDLLLVEYGITGLSETQIAHFNLAWSRIAPWDDVVEGLTLLKQDYMIMPFSNGDLRCMVEIAKNGNLPWDAIISADFFKKVKPDLSIYHDAADIMNLRPSEIMMVACHARDLEAAMISGMRTAYVARPLENGPGSPPEDKSVPFDYDVNDFVELAAALTKDRANDA